MRLRRVRDIQRTGFPEAFAGAYKRVSRSHVAVFDRLVIEGSTSDRFRTFLGTASAQSNGAGVSLRVQRNHSFTPVVPSENCTSQFLYWILPIVGDARADANFLTVVAGPRSHVSGAGDNAELQSNRRQLGAWRTTDLGSAQACHQVQAETGEAAHIAVFYDLWSYSSRIIPLTTFHLFLFRFSAFQFVAHPNVQQLLAAIWYDGLPGFRRKSMIGQFIEIGKLGAMFPVYSTIYMLSPTSPMGLFMKKPFVKFICHSSSYAFFLSESPWLPVDFSETTRSTRSNFQRTP